MILKNSRHELFAQAVAGGKTPTIAYAMAGFKPSDCNGFRLLTVDSVRKRVNEIQSAMAARLIKQAYYTREWVAEQLIDNVERAKAAGDFGAATSALRLLGVERQMFVDRRESGAPGEFAGLTNADDVLAMVRKELGDTAAAALQAALVQPEAVPELPSLDASRDADSALN